MFELCRVINPEEYNPLAICSDAPFPQSWFYGSLREQSKMKALRYNIFFTDKNQTTKKNIGCVQFITFNLVKGKTYLYAPYGPVINEEIYTQKGEELMSFLKVKAEEICRSEAAAFIHFDPSVKTDVQKDNPQHNPQQFWKKYFKTTPSFVSFLPHFQPRTEWVLDLDKTPDQILSAMHEKTRYSVRMAERKGVVVEIITQNISSYFEEFYSLIKETSERNNFHLHAYEYYKSMFAEADRLSEISLSSAFSSTSPSSLNSQKNNFQIYLARAVYEGKTLVLDIMVRYGNMTTFVFGGSSNEYRNLAPSSITKWKALLYAKEIGSHQFNLGGYAPEGSKYTGWEGFSEFKRKFGGYMQEHGNMYDYVAPSAQSKFLYYTYILRKLYHYVSRIIKSKFKKH